MKKVLSVFLSLVMVISILPLGIFEIKASAATWDSGFADNTTALNEIKALMQTQTTSYKISRFNYILDEYPLTKYFNTKKDEACDWHCAYCTPTSQFKTCMNVKSFYDKETGKTVSLSSGGNVWQCAAFGNYCEYRFFGRRMTSSDGITVSSSIMSNATSFKNYIASFDDLTGSHFRVNAAHSLVYLARDSTYIYFIDANSGYNSATGGAKGKCGNSNHTSTCCKINLRRFTYSGFISAYGSLVIYTTATSSGSGSGSSTPKLTIKYNVNGGTISSDTYGLNSDGLVKRLSDNSVDIQVNSYGEYQKYGLYDYDTFGLSKKGYRFVGWTLSNNKDKVYDMSAAWYPEEIYPDLSKGSATITAYAVWEPYKLTIKYDSNGGKISSSKADTYYLQSDGLVKKKSDDKVYTQTPKYGVLFENGFVDDTTLGLVREGYAFAGWSLATSGKTVYTDTQAWKPEEIYSNLKNGDATITAYAIWTPYQLSVTYNANGGYISDEKADLHSLTQNDMVFEKSVNGLYTMKRPYGTTVEWGFTDDSTLGLVKDCHKFVGWTLENGNGKVYDVLSPWNPEDIYPNLVNGNATITAYAVWEQTNHTYTNSHDTNCNICGEIRTITHDYKAATCVTPKTCKVCGVTSGKALGHTSDAGTITKKATCTATGTKTYKCTKCSITIKTESIAIIAHNYSSATCTKPQTCKVCSATTGKALGHKYTKVTTKAATTSKNGYVLTECSVCGKDKSKTTIYAAKTVKLSTSTYTYNGKTKKPTVTVKDSKGKTISSKYYTVTYASGRKNVGKYKVTVKFKGNYSGTKTLYLTINPTKTTVKKVTGASKSLKVTVNKKTTQVSGYQIQYSTSKKFTSAKTKTVKSAKTTSTTIKSLKAKKTYYVRVRTYKTVNGKRYYSGWSSYKSAKTK